MKFDYLVIGAGFAGLVFAERVANVLGRTCLVVDRRNHIGGNSFDFYNDAGVLVHKYGPHYFRTNSARVRDYLSQFTDWLPAEYKVQSYADNKYWSFPINLRTFEQLQGRECSESEFAAYLAANRVPIDSPCNSEEAVVSQVGWRLYELFFKNYTLKQWGRHPRELDASVCARIPIRVNRDDRYLSEAFQALPKGGYSRMFERILASSSKIKVLLNTDYKELGDSVVCSKVVCTGPIDEYFDYRFGALPYRSLRFEEESFSGEQLSERCGISGKCGFWQPSLQVNYPNDFTYTRTVELKHITGQKCDCTTVVREYPSEFGAGCERYYPIPNLQTEKLLAEYRQFAESCRSRTIFLGRLAEYRYYNMDQVVARALDVFESERSATVQCDGNL